MIQSMYSNEKYINAYDTGVGNFLADTSVDSALAQVDCWCGGLISIGVGPQFTTSNGPAFQPPLLELLPRIKFWNQRLVQHGYASVANKITALNGEDACTIYGCGTDFLLELVGGTGPGSHFGLFVTNTTRLGVGVDGGGRGRRVQQISPLPHNSTILAYLSPGVSYANLSVGAEGNTLTFFLCSNFTVFLSGTFWLLANENVKEVVEAASGAIVSQRMLFPGPKSGQARHFFSLSAGETVMYTKMRTKQ